MTRPDPTLLLAAQQLLRNTSLSVRYLLQAAGCPKLAAELELDLDYMAQIRIPPPGQTGAVSCGATVAAAPPSKGVVVPFRPLSKLPQPR